MSTWMIPVMAVHITLNMPLYSVCGGGGGGGGAGGEVVSEFVWKCKLNLDAWKYFGVLFDILTV